MTNLTPTVRCTGCDHPIDSHTSDAVMGYSGCLAPCPCTRTPNLIAVAMLFGDLTPTPDTHPRSVRRDPATGEWS